MRVAIVAVVGIAVAVLFVVAPSGLFLWIALAVVVGAFLVFGIDQLDRRQADRLRREHEERLDEHLKQPPSW